MTAVDHVLLMRRPGGRASTNVFAGSDARTLACASASGGGAPSSDPFCSGYFHATVPGGAPASSAAAADGS